MSYSSRHLIETITGKPCTPLEPMKISRWKKAFRPVLIVWDTFKSMAPVLIIATIWSLCLTYLIMMAVGE